MIAAWSGEPCSAGAWALAAFSLASACSKAAFSFLSVSSWELSCCDTSGADVARNASRSAVSFLTSSRSSLMVALSSDFSLLNAPSLVLMNWLFFEFVSLYFVRVSSTA